MAKKLKEAGTYIGHTGCPECGSSDAGSVYKHDDGSYSMTCFSCKKGFPEWNYEEDKMVTHYTGEGDKKNRTFLGRDMDAVKTELCAMSLKDRKIPESTLKDFGALCDIDDDGEVCAHYYPVWKHEIEDDETSPIVHTGYRIRHKFPDDYKKPELRGKMKDFSGGVGDISGKLCMYGQWLMPEGGGKRLIIVGGEVDAKTGHYMIKMSIEKARQKNYLVVSVPSGENIRGIKDNWKWITSFEEIILAFDNDDVGQKLTKETLKILPIEKVRIFHYPEGVKDLNQWWTENYKDRKNVLVDFKSRIYNAESYCPAGVKNFADGFEAMKNRGLVQLIPFPSSMGDLNVATYGGMGLGEITTVIAPSSVGKSAFTREMAYTAWNETEYHIGIIPVEDTYEELMEMFCAIHLNKQINEIPYDERDWDEIKKAHAELSEGRRIHIVDHQGAINKDNLLEFIDYLVNVVGCKLIICDPITLALSGADTDEEEVLSEILRRVKRYKYAHVNVCHVRKNQGGQKANSEGGDIAEEDIKGTGAYFQISMNNIILTRNKVDPDPVKKNLTRIKLSKCRRHGKSTGVVGYTWYNGDTGRLERAGGRGDDIDKAAENIRLTHNMEIPVDEFYEDEGEAMGLVIDGNTGEVLS